MNLRRFLWQLIGIRPWTYVVDASLTLAVWVLFLVPAYVVQQFFQSLARRSDNTGIFQLLAILVVAQVARMVVGMAVIWTDTTWQRSVGAQLQSHMFEHVLGHAVPDELPNTSGEAVSRFREDVDLTTTFLSWTSLLDVIGAGVFAVVAVIIMLRINTMITLVVFVPLTVVVVVAKRATPRLQSYRKSNREATGAVTSFIAEMFAAVQTIQVVSAEQDVLARFGKVNDKRRRATVLDVVFSTALNGVFGNIVEIGTGIILLLAAHAMKDGSFTVGDFALFVYFLTWITQLTGRAGRLLTGYKQVAVSVQRMDRLRCGISAQLRCDCSPAQKLPDYMKENWTLDVEGLSYRFPETDKGIENVNLHISPKNIVVVTGSMGSGKTTLIRALLGLVVASAGSVRWNGQLVTDPAGFFVPSRVAYTPQMPHLFSDTLQSNILLGAEERGDRLRQAVSLAALDSDLEEFPRGLATIVGPNGATLSGGQVHRAAMARMYMRQAQLYILDDPTSALDSATETLLCERIVTVRNEGASFLIISSSPKVLELADEVILLSHGYETAHGTLSDVLARSSEMQRLWAGQSPSIGLHGLEPKRPIHEGIPAS